MLSLVKDLIQVSRPGWWLVTLWLYVAPCEKGITNVDVTGLLFVLLPLNTMVYGMNDASDLDNDLSNDRKGNFIFGPKGWSKERLNRVLTPAIGVVFLTLVHWGLETKQLLLHMMWFATALAVNYLYNFHSSSWNMVFVFVGYGSVTLLSYWRHGGRGFGLERSSDGRWYFGGCNQEYWMHLTLLLVRSQLWTELLDYESDRKANKRTTLSRQPTKELARRLVLGVLLLEVLWCSVVCRIHGSHWSMLLVFAIMGVVCFGCLEYALPSAKNSALVVDLTYLALLQNAGGIQLLYDCWSRGIFVR
jgi:4-hydroxybenzoate polyprenyltransferase